MASVQLADEAESNDMVHLKPEQGRGFMNPLATRLAAVCSLVVVSSASHAGTIAIDLSSAVFTGGAGPIAGGARRFDSATASI
jgi:hypothetical protein